MVMVTSTLIYMRKKCESIFFRYAWICCLLGSQLILLDKKIGDMK